jgi:protein-tyrosine phosphatase
VYKILDNLATHGIAYNHDDNNYYLISKDSVSEEEILTFPEATDEDGNKWLIVDARILSDYKANEIQGYLALMDTCSLVLKQNHRILVCCGAGISRSNA